MEKHYTFKTEDFETQLPVLIKNGVTELSIYDKKLSSNKKGILRIINLIKENAPDMFVSILIDASVIDREVVSSACDVFISFEIPLLCFEKGGKLLFDKKFYASKSKLLNDYALVFGFELTYANVPGDSVKLFMDRLDFAVTQYPNHIEFPQLEKEDFAGEGENEPKVSATFSAKDIRFARDVAFACRTFYSQGRAVPWFLSVLRPLRIYPSKFFADAAEWQRCNNCDFKSGFIPEDEEHTSIEKMQLLFLDEKYEEKGRHSLIQIVHDIVKINGAMSRLAGENVESVVQTSYNPDDLFSEEAMDIESFSENVCMEECSVKIYAGKEGPEYLCV